MRKASQIAASIKTLGAGFAKKSAEVQALLVEIAGHMVCHKEASLGLKMLNEFKGTKHAESIARWLAEYTVFSLRDGKAVINETRFKELTKGFFSNKDGQHVEAAEQHIATLADVPAWDFEPESEDSVARVFDALTRTETLLNTIAKKVAKGEGEHLDLERYLRQALEQYKADRAVFDKADRAVFDKMAAEAVEGE